MEKVAVFSKKDVDSIKKQLHEKVCKVVFTKVNGDTRVMHCTLNPDMLPEETESSRAKKENDSVQAVYDVEAKGWRSFRWDSLTSFSTEFNI